MKIPSKSKKERVYFAVYIPVEGIPSDKVEKYLNKAKKDLSKDKLPHEQFFFIADRNCSTAHIERL